jgi:hypothetical protein
LIPHNGAKDARERSAVEFFEFVDITGKVVSYV